MPDYQKMYYYLFNEVTKAIEILRKAQCETEELFIRSPATDNQSAAEKTKRQ